MRTALLRETRQKSRHRCLVLNADYRPLTSCPLSLIGARDAVTAAWRDRVDVVETWPNLFFHSPSVTIAIPKVVALRHFAPVNGEPKFNRLTIFLRDRYRCQYCGERFPSSELTYDHVIPKSRGGQTVWTNIVTACIDCNTEKSNKLPNYSARKAVGKIRPLKEPYRPTAAQLLRAGMEFVPTDVREDFADFLYWNVELSP